MASTTRFSGAAAGKELADDLGVPLIGQVPLDPFIVEGGDAGAPAIREHPNSPAARAITAAAQQLVALVPPAEDESCTSRIAVLAEQLEQMAQA